MEKQQIKNFWRHFKKNRLGVGGLVIIVIVFLIAILVPFLSPYDPGKTGVSLKLKSPSFQHYLGSDQLGRDVFSRMLYGSQISLSVGFVAVGISILFGIMVGGMGGFKGGGVDSL